MININENSTKEQVLKALAADPSQYKNASNTLRDDVEVVLCAIRFASAVKVGLEKKTVLPYLSDKLLSDRTFLEKALPKFPELMEKVDKSLIDDDFICRLIEDIWCPSRIKNYQAFMSYAIGMPNSEAIMIKLGSKNWQFIKDMGQVNQANPKIILAILKSHQRLAYKALKYASSDLQNDLNFLIQAVDVYKDTLRHMYPDTLRHLSESIKLYDEDKFRMALLLQVKRTDLDCLLTPSIKSNDSFMAKYRMKTGKENHQFITPSKLSAPKNFVHSRPYTSNAMPALAEYSPTTAHSFDVYIASLNNNESSSQPLELDQLALLHDSRFSQSKQINSSVEDYTGSELYKFALNCIETKDQSGFNHAIFSSVNSSKSTLDLVGLMCKAIECGCKATVQQLLDQGLKADDLCTPLYDEHQITITEYSLYTDQQEIFQLLLLHGFNHKAPLYITDCFFECITKDFADAVRCILDLYPEELNKRRIINGEEIGYSAFEYAAIHGKIECVKVLCEYKAEPGSGVKNNVLFYTLQEISSQTSSDKLNVYQEIIALLVNYAPPSIIWLQRDNSGKYRHPWVKKIYLNRDMIQNKEIDEQMIKKLPLHISEIVCAMPLSEPQKRMFVELRSDISLHQPLNNKIMFVDEKYIRGRLPKIERFNAEKTDNNINSIYQNENRVTIKFSHLKDLKNKLFDEPSSTVQDLSPKNDMYEFIASANKGELRENNKTFIVYGYRQDNACLPVVVDNQCRCIIVLTLDEYNGLKIPTSSNLNLNYDFLILHPRKKFESDIDVKISTITERRRAATLFCRNNSLKNVVAMDDNIQEQALLNEVSLDSKNSEYLYDFLQKKLSCSGNSIAAVSTYSRLNRGIRDNQIGAKSAIINIEKLTQALPGECYDTLLPYNEMLCLEDFYMALMVAEFCSDPQKKIKGYEVLPGNEIQLKRSLFNKSAAKKSGVQIREYTEDDVLHPKLREKIKQSYPEIYERIEKVRMEINGYIKKALADYENKEKFLRTTDISQLRKDASLPRTCVLIKFINISSCSSSDSSLSIVNKAIKNGTLYWQAGSAICLYQNKLFYAESCGSIVNEIIETDDLQDAYHSLQENIHSQVNEKRQANLTELHLVQTLLKPKQGQKFELSGDFISDLTTILTQTIYNFDSTSSNSETKNLLLREHQINALRWFIECLDHTSRKNFTFNMATGTGKSILILILALVVYAADPNKSVMVVFPSIQLVHQTLEKLFAEFGGLLTFFNIDRSVIFGVCSQKSEKVHANEIVSQKLILVNEKLRANGIYFACDASAAKLCQVNGNDDGVLQKAFIKNLSSVINDESHKIREKSVLNVADYVAEHFITINFSATPSNNMALTSSEIEFQYLRQQAIKEKILAPLMIDKTLPSNTRLEDIAYCLSNHRHPNGGYLKEHKGIIYMASIEEANALAKVLSDDHELVGLPIHLIHSKTDGCRVNLLNAFKQAEKGLAIVVRMLVEGYDDENIDYIITNQDQISKDNLHQEVGRALRLNKDKNPNKVGYAILREDNTKNDAAELSCFPDDKQAFMEQLIGDFGNIRSTIEQYRGMSDKKRKDRQQTEYENFSNNNELDNDLNNNTQKKIKCKFSTPLFFASSSPLTMSSANINSRKIFDGEDDLTEEDKLRQLGSISLQ